MLYLTGSGLSPKTIPILSAHPMIGVLSTPNSLARSYVEAFKNWGADNGCFTQGERFSMDRYLRWLGRMRSSAAKCLFATAPDVVADARKTWARSEPTFEAIRAAGFKAALVAQNGVEDMELDWTRFDALFVGGDTDWKLSSAARDICREAKRRGQWVHMGRVNSLRRLEIAESFGCDSVDGNFLGFGPETNIPRLMRWLDSLSSSPMLRLG